MDTAMKFFSAVWRFFLRLCFCHTPAYLYHYSTAQASKITPGFLFKVNTQGRMYALDMDFGHASISKNSKSALIVFSGEAVRCFVRHNPFYIFGFKLFWGHYATPNFGDVEFTRVRHHAGNVVEVEAFQVLEGKPTSNPDQWSKVCWAAAMYGVILLSGPVIAFLCVWFSGDVCFSKFYYRSLLELWWVLCLPFGMGVAIPVFSWVKESLNFGGLNENFYQAGLHKRPALFLKVLLVLWAWLMSGVWVVLVFLYVLVPWVWLVSSIYFEEGCHVLPLALASF